VVAKTFVLLERRVVLFVYDDQSEIRDRGKQRGTRPDGDLHAPAAERLPGVVALAQGQTAVKHGDLVSEPRAKTSDELRGQRDLWNQQQRASAGSAHFIDRAQVDLGLARSSHAMQKKRFARAFVDRLPDGLDRVLLGCGRRGRLIASDRRAEEWVSARLDFFEFDEPLARE
jgi:hypothetical protein